MRRILSLFAFLLLVPASALAKVEGTLSPAVWYVDTEVTVTGSDLLGPSPSKSKICFAPEANQEDLRCFLATHTNVTNWGNNNITFIPPRNTPPIGVVILMHPYSEMKCEYLYNKNVCQAETIKTKYLIGSYKANPFINEIKELETGNALTKLEVGVTYEIKGYRFGDTGYGVYAGLRLIDRPDILLWTHDTIRFRLSKEPEDGSSIQVHNGAGKSNVWAIGEITGSGTAVKTKTRGTIIVGQPADTTLAASVTETASGTGSTAEASSSSVPLFEDAAFIDIPSSHPYIEAIRWAKTANFVGGYEDGTFRPGQAVTRAELMKLLFVHEPTLLTNPPPPSGMWDVDPHAWYAPYVRFAVSKGVVQGYGDKSFHPHQAVTVAEALKILYRSMAVPTLDPMGSEWYARYHEHALINDMLFDPSLAPDTPMSRADVVWTVWRILQYRGFLPTTGN